MPFGNYKGTTIGFSGSFGGDGVTVAELGDACPRGDRARADDPGRRA